MRPKIKTNPDNPYKSDVLVQNYGLFWSREYVDWKSKILQGKIVRNAGPNQTKESNFWNQVGLYVLYNDSTPIYIGQAGIRQRVEKEEEVEAAHTLGFRLREHTKDNLAELWDHFSWVGFKATTKQGTLAQLSRRSIKPLSEVHLLESMLIALFGGHLENKQDGAWNQLRVKRYDQIKKDDAWKKNNPQMGKLLDYNDTITRKFTALADIMTTIGKDASIKLPKKLIKQLK